MPNAHVIGVDVGGARKQFDVAVLCGREVLDLRRRQSLELVTDLVRKITPAVVAIDSPAGWASGDERSRAGERELVSAKICNIRWTPSQQRSIEVGTSGSGYYDWIERGLELYSALRAGPWTVIECFPTASWTRWAKPRGQRRRAAWTRDVLSGLGLSGVEPLNQDQRDAVAAAITARQYLEGPTDRFGDIVVPLPGPP
jgi:predicted nuclease with RNAse H fold